MNRTELVQKLIEKKFTLSCAESLTAGLVSAAVCDVPGASRTFQGGVAAYQDEVKHQVLGVQSQTLSAHTAVSAPCAKEMAEGARALFDTDFALSTTGYAGPDGENVGLVYVGAASRRHTSVYELHFAGSRQAIRQMTVQLAFYALEKEMEQNGEG